MTANISRTRPSQVKLTSVKPAKVNSAKIDITKIDQIISSASHENAASTVDAVNRLDKINRFFDEFSDSSEVPDLLIREIALEIKSIAKLLPQLVASNSDVTDFVENLRTIIESYNAWIPAESRELNSLITTHMDVNEIATIVADKGSKVLDLLSIDEIEAVYHSAIKELGQENDDNYLDAVEDISALKQVFIDGISEKVSELGQKRLKEAKQELANQLAQYDRSTQKTLLDQVGRLAQQIGVLAYQVSVDAMNFGAGRPSFGSFSKLAAFYSILSTQFGSAAAAAIQYASPCETRPPVDASNPLIENFTQAGLSALYTLAPSLQPYYNAAIVSVLGTNSTLGDPDPTATLTDQQSAQVLENVCASLYQEAWSNCPTVAVSTVSVCNALPTSWDIDKCGAALTARQNATCGIGTEVCVSPPPAPSPSPVSPPPPPSSLPTESVIIKENEPDYSFSSLPIGWQVGLIASGTALVCLTIATTVALCSRSTANAKTKTQLKEDIATLREYKDTLSSGRSDSNQRLDVAELRLEFIQTDLSRILHRHNLQLSNYLSDQDKRDLRADSSLVLVFLSTERVCSIIKDIRKDLQKILAKRESWAVRWGCRNIDAYIKAYEPADSETAEDDAESELESVRTPQPQISPLQVVPVEEV